MLKQAPVEVNWFLPTNGDGRHLTSSGLPKAALFQQGERAPTLDYLRQIVRAAQLNAFDSIMIPTASGFEDPWLIATVLAQEVQDLRFLLTVRPGVELPAYTLHKAVTLQRICGDRLALHIVTGSSRFEQRALGDFLEHDQRYARTEEFLRLFQALWAGEGRHHQGRHYPTGPLQLETPQSPLPQLYFGGASTAAQRVAASQAHVYLMWGEPPAMIEERIRQMRALAAAAGRELRFGLRLHIFAAPSSEQAWEQVERLLEEIPRNAIAQAQQQLDTYESVGQSRQNELHRGRQLGARELEVSPNLWAGVGLVRGGAGTALVGSYSDVVERLEEYRALGIGSFTLSGYPHLEEALHLGSELLPRLRSLPGW
ncbi:LLM class flavin-dependent oxidoreductase [Stutzerimonas kirkiae]|uniref:LLM class flavin-dependent oxidoreductase n=1 Tax=Stutzerimonas kirkiae TaxID=2211392 RepID=UPI0010385DBD|nr:LLM class flavin-dependent oxidoreductase [Stutzerimonas kirkiae]TBV10490.1 alkanesulfonate monooxygenase [Stutzerimonas kirkiae]TBV13954.1 alkanesulfonate monooxygenase [Stutzerimonas kirkiae]